MPAKTASRIDEETVARKAYEIWAARGYEHGSDMDDWFRAEAELRDGVQTVRRPRATKTPARRKSDA